MPPGKRCELGLKAAAFGGDFYNARRFWAGSSFSLSSALVTGSTLPLALLLEFMREDWRLNVNPLEEDAHAALTGVFGF